MLLIRTLKTVPNISFVLCVEMPSELSKVLPEIEFHSICDSPFSLEKYWKDLKTRTMRGCTNCRWSPFDETRMYAQLFFPRLKNEPFSDRCVTRLETWLLYSNGKRRKQWLVTGKPQYHDSSRCSVG